MCLTTAESLSATAALSSNVSSKLQQYNRESEWAGEEGGRREGSEEVNESQKLYIANAEKPKTMTTTINNNSEEEEGEVKKRREK